jgi:hypothetical protein
MMIQHKNVSSLPEQFNKYVQYTALPAFTCLLSSEWVHPDMVISDKTDSRMVFQISQKCVWYYF